MLPSIFGENLFDEFFTDPFAMMDRSVNNVLYGKHASREMKTESACASTVASPAPNTPQPNPATNRTSQPILIRQDRTRYFTGVPESPILRSPAA